MVGRSAATLLLTGLLITASASSAGTSGATIRFRQDPAVNDTVIRFGDVASITGAADAVAKRLLDAIVGEAAPAGFSRLVSCQSILQAASRIAPEIGLSCDNADPVSVKTLGVTRTVQEFSDTILNFVRGRLPWNASCATVTLENGTRSFMVLDHPYTCRILPPAAGIATARGPVHLYLDIAQGSRHYRIPAVCRVTVKMPVVVTTAKIPQGDRITPANAEIRVMDITNYRYDCMTGLDSMDVRIATRTLSPGTILHEKNARPAPLIEKGDGISLVSEQGSIKVSISGRAREDGVLGQKIWVQNLQNLEILRGTVTGKNEVTIRRNGEDV